MRTSNALWRPGLTGRRGISRLAAGCSLGLALALAFAGAPAARGQQAELTAETYLQPSEVIQAAVLAPWHENVSLQNISPDGQRFLLEIGDGMPSIDTLGAPHTHLAELRIDTEGYRVSRLSQRSFAGLEVFDATTRQKVAIQIPAGARVSNPSWSPDGARLAFFAIYPDATHIYLADPASGQSTRLTPRPVLATHMANYQWSADGNKLVAVLVPEDVSERAAQLEAGTEPLVRVARDGRSPNRTYRYLLETPADVRALEHYSTGQPVTIGVPSGEVVAIGQAGMVQSINSDPRGEHFRISYWKSPFSYFVPMSQFGSREVVQDSSGAELVELNQRDLRDGTTSPTAAPAAAGGPAASPRNDKRNLRWHPDGGSMVFLQQEPAPEAKPEASPAAADPAPADNAAANAGGRARTGSSAASRPAPRKDRVILWKPPYGEGDTEILFESDSPIRSYDLSSDGRWLFVTRSIPVAGGASSSSRAPATGRRGGGTTGASGAQTASQPTTQTVHAVDLANDKATYQIFKGRSTDGTGRPARGEHGEEQFAEADLWHSWNQPGYDDAWAFPGESSEFGREDGNWQDPVTAPPASDPPAVADNQDPQTPPADAPPADAPPADQPTDDPPAGEPARERGASAGTLMRKSRGDGEQFVRVSSDGYVYFSGSARGGSEESASDPGNDPPDNPPAANAATSADEETVASRPPKSFIDRVKIETGEVERIFETTDELLETILAVDGDDIGKVYTVRQNRDVVPDYFVHVRGTGEIEQLTHNRNFTPWFNRLKVEHFEVTRPDGFKFWVKVTSNPDFGQKLPAMFWFYPREYTDQKTYEQRATQTMRSQQNSFRFQRPGNRSMSILTQIGYVVVEPDLPIVGPTGRMNDNYVNDLRNGLWAVIDELDRRNIIDRNRLGLGGHSYGAFSTANAMVHTPFFKAGIAGDGNYNRTLTPMSFQSERRHFWDARETYLEMSPMFYAHRLSGALLMYHGMEDANTGTFPINSERMFQALDGLGKPSALYMYPYEAHGPVARETILDMWARWTAWLDHYVKNPPPPVFISPPGEGRSGEPVAEPSRN